ncbi:hypothetical protein PHLGIDRAFT_18535 [Phlebiopsis gigantea 11061_1 CR5-6]|uniref:Protein kinase domain-containing protein n=1 Tax=Phlebiopsis gigantea (strain 11061_1 CR5-6) TaxID=745531 RepID=A0A0C3S307_PHLG1|nr:hypothetical protein PHLGIDRAFT_18535 [Phlebiopsis gigantea 11061_1 CR5-6]
MTNALNKGVEGLAKVLDHPATSLVIQTASIVVNTGAAPIPNCITPILDTLTTLQQTIGESKALQKRCSSLIKTCIQLHDLLQPHANDVQASQLEESLVITLDILQQAQKAMRKHSRKSLFRAMLTQSKMKKDAATHDMRVKNQLALYELDQSKEALSNAHDIRESTIRNAEQLEIIATNLEALVPAAGPVQMPNLQALQRSEIHVSLDVTRSETQNASTSADCSLGNITEISIDDTTESTEPGPTRKRYFVPELDRQQYGRAQMELGSKCLEYWIASRRNTIAKEQIAIRMPRDSVERHVKRGIKGIANELEIWSHLKHPCVVPFLGTMWFELPVNKKSLLGLVAPYYSHGNVNDYVKANPSVNRLQLLIDAARGLEYLHSQCVAHGDVRGSSILINDSEQAMIGDFHMSRFVDVEIDIDPNTEDEFEAETHWRAPELMVDYHPPTLQSDIWSFAMTVFEVATGTKPLHADGLRTEVRAMIGTKTQGILPLRPWNVWLTDEIWELLMKCWNLKAEERPNIQDCLAVLRKANEQWLEEHKT